MSWMQACSTQHACLLLLLLHCSRLKTLIPIVMPNGLQPRNSKVHDCMQAVVAGQALAGLLVSLLSLLTTWLNPPQSHMAPTPADVRSAAVAYFTGSAGVMAAALLGYLALPHLRFAQQHTLLGEQLVYGLYAGTNAPQVRALQPH